MTRLLTFAATLLFCFCACTPKTPDDTPSDKPDGLPDPEITVTGAPTGNVEAGQSFTVTVKSKSEAPLTYSIDRPDVVSIAITKQRVYSVRTNAPSEDTDVTVTFSQKEGMGYAAATYEMKFKVLKKVKKDNSIPGEPTEDLDGVKTVYSEVSGNVLNPERGFYKAGDIRSASNPVTASSAKACRTSGYSLMYVGYYLTDFMNGDISQEYLDMIQASMDAIREGGIKCILRFAYQSSENSYPWDAPVDIVLRHIEQLKPLLQKNEDVIFVLQAGFVGVWGEWYYTSNFIRDPSKDEDYLPRKQVCDALLEALPQSRQVALRTPEFKMRMYKLSLADTLNTATAHNGSDLSRICGHNDCFGASSNDMGTFDNSTDRTFWKFDSRYTLMGGETCQVSEYCLCDNTLKDLADYHWTYLNISYNGSVITRWRNTGCLDEITSHLGYRLVLKDSFHTDTHTAGDKMSVTIRFCNKGYAAPQNPRNAKLVFIASDGARTEFPLDSDPRDWHTGWYSVTSEITLPAASGSLYLDLSDPLLSERPEYSIALANEGVFDEATGLNKLFDI